MSVFYDSYQDVATIRMERGEPEGVRWRLRRWGRRIGFGLLGIAAIGLLWLLYEKTQSGKVAGEGADAALRRVHQLDSDWNVAVMGAKVGLSDDYDALVAVPRRMREELRALQAAGAAADADIGARLTQLGEALARKADLVESFKSHNSILRNSLRYLPSAADTALAAVPASSADLRSRVDRALEEALKFAAVPEVAQRERLEEELAAISNLLDGASLPDASREAVKGFNSHARAVVREMRVEGDLLARILDVPVVSNIQNTSAAYIAFNARRTGESDDWRRALVAYSALLLMLVAYTAWRLQQSYRQIRSMNGALLEANHSLEDRVRERTEELRRTLESLHESERQLIQSEKMSSLGQMVAGIVHEINTPLAYVRSSIETVNEELEPVQQLVEETRPLSEFAEALAQHELIPELRKLTAETLYGLDQIAEIVKNLKNFSRLDRSKATPFDLREGLESTLSIARATVKHCEVVRDYAAIPTIACAPSQLNQVFLNLITNAAQALTDHGGRITLRTREERGQVRVDIADNGCGIASEHLSRIFDPFFTTKDVGKGTGLGLSIAYKIVQEHGGTIEVDSGLGVGTCFTIRLPLAPEPSGAALEAA